MNNSDPDNPGGPHQTPNSVRQASETLATAHPPGCHLAEAPQPRGRIARRLRRKPRTGTRPARPERSFSRPPSSPTGCAAARCFLAFGYDTFSAKAPRRSSATGQHLDHGHPEPALGPQTRPPSRSQLIPAPRRIPAAAQQPIPLAATKHVMKNRLRGRLASKHANLARRAARPKRPSAHRIQDRELNQPKRIAGVHSSSLRPLEPAASRRRATVERPRRAGGPGPYRRAMRSAAAHRQRQVPSTRRQAATCASLSYNNARPSAITAPARSSATR
jgi:hypothetical protein